MKSMFESTSIEDSGIANWNTASLTDASRMFFEARSLRADLDLSGWIFGPRPNMNLMFAQSSIVDCGIGRWDVTEAITHEMLLGASNFTGSLASWHVFQVDLAGAPREVVLRHGSARTAFGFGGADKQIAAVFAAALRERVKGAQGRGGEQCAIL
jgi:hypothetical protein